MEKSRIECEETSILNILLFLSLVFSSILFTPFLSSISTIPSFLSIRGRRTKGRRRGDTRINLLDTNKKRERKKSNGARPSRLTVRYKLKRKYTSFFLLRVIPFPNCAICNWYLYIYIQGRRMRDYTVLRKLNIMYRRWISFRWFDPQLCGLERVPRISSIWRTRINSPFQLALFLLSTRNYTTVTAWCI